MEKVSFICEWITPALWGGADPEGTPEIRSASLKGLLRYWWRALYLGCGGSYHNLYAREAQLFGSTDAASPLIVRAYGELKEPVQIDPSNNLSLRDLQYFLFPFRRNERKAHSDRNTFTVEIGLRPGVSNTEALKWAVASFWLLAHLGGIGARSRRGFGSFKIVKVEGWKSFPLFAKGKSEEYTAWLREEITRWRRQLCSTPLSSSMLELPPSPTLTPTTVKVALWNGTYSTWQEALQRVALSLNDFRKRHRPDYDNVKKALSSQDTKLTLPIERAGFGLPIVFYFRSLQGLNGTLQGSDKDRRASPLILKTAQLDEQCYTVQASFFRAALLPSEECLILKRKSSRSAKSTEPLSSYQKEALDWVEKWLTSADWHITTLV